MLVQPWLQVAFLTCPFFFGTGTSSTLVFLDFQLHLLDKHWQDLGRTIAQLEVNASSRLLSCMLNQFGSPVVVPSYDQSANKFIPCLRPDERHVKSAL
jgi:hypothetical protein